MPAPSDTNLQSLIGTAAPQGGSPVSGAPGAPGAPNAPGGTEIEQLSRELAQLMVSNPQLAQQIVNVLEGQGAGTAGAPTMPPRPSAPSVPPAPAPNPSPTPAMDPQLMQELAALKGQVGAMQAPLADYQLQQQLNDASKKYGTFRQHFGPVLPENFDQLQRPMLEKYQALLNGQIPHHEAALHLAVLEHALQGDKPLKDRLVAALASQGGQPPAVEGKGGTVVGQQAPTNKVYKTTAERLAALKQLHAQMMAAQPGS